VLAADHNPPLALAAAAWGSHDNSLGKEWINRFPNSNSL
jgi:hypothetical protein